MGRGPTRSYADDRNTSPGVQRRPVEEEARKEDAFSSCVDAINYVRWHNLGHVDPFPNLLEYISALLTLSNRARLSSTLAKALVSALGINRVAIDDINSERGVWDDERGLSSEE